MRRLFPRALVAFALIFWALVTNAGESWVIDRLAIHSCELAEVQRGLHICSHPPFRSDLTALTPVCVAIAIGGTNPGLLRAAGTPI